MATVDPAATLVIRRATTADVSALGRMAAQLVAAHHAFDPQRFFAPGPGTSASYGSFLGGRIAAPDAIVLVAELDGTVVGYAFGSVEGYDTPCRRLALKADCVVVSVDYRLAPEHPFPAAVHDAWDATTWCVRNARELRADPRRVVVGGDSAGGTLSAVVAQQARDEGGPAIALQVLIYPATDLTRESDSYVRNAQGCMRDRDLVGRLGGEGLVLGDGVLPRGAVLRRDEPRQVVPGHRVRVAVQLEAVPLDLNLVAVLEPLQRLLEAAAPEVAVGADDVGPDVDPHDSTT